MLMKERQGTTVQSTPESAEEISRFADSYASFNRIINNLQRQYIALEEEFGEQNRQLIETNRKLVDMTGRNLKATEFLNGILTSISAGVIAVDRQGHVTHFNPAASLLLGIPANRVVGSPYRDIIPPGRPVEANALRTVESGHGCESVEKSIDLPDGTKLLVSVSTALIRDDHGEPVGAVEVFHDLSRIKKMEQELVRLTTLAALGEMAATIAHEVRNPLSGIGGFASLLKRDMAEDDPRQRLVDKITRGVESLNKTVTTLLNYTRFDEVNKEDVDFGEFLNRIAEQYGHDHADIVDGSTIEIAAAGPRPRPVRVRVDPMLLRQLFYNLYTNAIEAASRAVIIQVTYAQLPRQTAVQKYGDRVLLGVDETVIETVVSDNGPGITPEHLERVFSPFFTTKQDGNGLGLAVSWKVAKAHGGDILAANTADGGAKFTLLIPAKIDPVDREPNL
ncbi:hypothetical protein C3F09_11205 [candidate division GN15 bacterium]|uniref:histidine kinase n=1 Tax=candidate division GN15 bacterium TaxID=2072418 RepID=A0A855WVL1_9BACT|nr:MAG: hypothetical protein C3F09_11205 [candidate division GN15 bacterium]